MPFFFFTSLHFFSLLFTSFHFFSLLFTSFHFFSILFFSLITLDSLHFQGLETFVAFDFAFGCRTFRFILWKTTRCVGTTGGPLLSSTGSLFKLVFLSLILPS